MASTGFSRFPAFRKLGLQRRITWFPLYKLAQSLTLDAPFDISEKECVLFCNNKYLWLNCLNVF